MPTFQNGMVIGLGRWVGRHPLFAAALVTVTCVAVADFHLGWAFLAGMGFAGVGVLCRGWRCGVFWLLCAWLAVGNFTWRKDAQKAAELAIPGGPGGWETARVLEDGRGNERFWVAPAKLLEGANAGARVWWEGAGEVPVAGAVVAADGAFEPLPELRNPGAFDRGEWLRSMGVAAVFRANSGAGRVETGRLAEFGAGIRHGFRNSVTAGLPEASQEAGVIRAVVIGEKPPDSEELIAAFRNSGTLHVFSVSGLHVAMVGSIGWLLLSWAGVSRRWAVLALLPLVFGYAWITGHSPPAVRAAWMCAVFLGAFGFRRRPDLLNALGAVLLVAMLWDGRLLFQPGVQMSYGVVAAIAIGVAWASRAFKWMAVPELYMPMEMMGRRQKAWLGLRRKTAQSMSVSLAAGVGSAPLTAFHFGLVTPISVLAGLVLVPLVYLLLSAALLSVVAACGGTAGFPVCESWKRMGGVALCAGGGRVLRGAGRAFPGGPRNPADAAGLRLGIRRWRGLFLGRRGERGVAGLWRRPEFQIHRETLAQKLGH